MTKFLTYFLLFFAVVAFAAEARKGGHHQPPVVNITEVTEVTEVTNITTDTAGIASAVATGQCQFDNSTYSLQGCVALGNYESENALVFGMGKRYKETLINGTVAFEGSDLAVGVGVNWKF